MSRIISSILCVALVAGYVVSALESEVSDVGTNKMKPDMPQKMCTREFSPVCGSDGMTYGNKCEFENAKDRKQSDLSFKEGPC